MSLCGNVACDLFGYDHQSEHPCGTNAERPGEPCRYCGRELNVGEWACPNCWVPISALTPDGQEGARG